MPLDARVAGGCASEETRGAGNRVFLGLSFCLKRLHNFWSRNGNLDDFLLSGECCGHSLFVLPGSVDGRYMVHASW